MVRPREQGPAGRRRSCAHMSSTRKRAPARRARARRSRGSSARRRRGWRSALSVALAGALAVLRALRPRGLDQRTRDVVGLVLLALGTYLALVLYGGLAGGSAGGTGGSSRLLQARGGVVGEAVYAPARHLVSDAGVTILVVCLIRGGLGLLTGTSFGAAVRALARGAVRAIAFIRALGAERLTPTP